MNLTRITAGLIAATIAGSGAIAMGATSASAATSVQTTVSSISTSAPVMAKWRCFWIGKHGKVHFGKRVNKAVFKWKNGHWVIKRVKSCSKVKKWRW